MPLVEPVPLIPPSDLGRMHFIAIGGAGMSPVASWYAALGRPTSGCDRDDSPTLRALARAGVEATVGHDPAHVAQADTVVVSSAIAEDNPELLTARAAGCRVWHRSAALGALMLGHTGIAVTGTHGKTTTSAMLTTALVAAGADPSAVIGATLIESGQSFRIGGGAAFVVEADESDGSFLQYPAETLVITNIEADHLVNWGTAEAYAAGFARLCAGDRVRRVVLDLDDPGALALAESLAGTRVDVIGVGEAPTARVRLSGLRDDADGTGALIWDEDRPYELTLGVPGRHNLHNAAAAFAAGRSLGLPADALLAGLRGYAGTARRFQRVGAAGGVQVFDDYAHHPTEVAAALAAARPRVGATGRLVACFQPHLYSRTQDFVAGFGQALAQADVVVVTDVYAAREEPIAGVTGELVARAAADAGATVAYVPDKADLPLRLAELVRESDLVVTLGAGDVTHVGPALLARLGGEGPHA